MRRAGAIALVLGAITVGVSGGAVVGLGVASSGKIAEGISIAGVDVAGLTPDEAARRVDQQVVAPLRTEVVVERRGKTFRLTPKESQIGADVDAAVDQAAAASQEIGPVKRAWNTVTGSHPDRSIELEPTWSRAAVQRFADRIRVAVDRQPREAQLVFAGDRPEVEKGRSGMVVDRPKLKEKIRDALQSAGDQPFLAPVERKQPKMSTAKLRKEHPTIVVVDRGRKELYLYKDLELSKTYRVAVGKAGLETPAGTYTINDKQVNPAWHVPNSDWAGDLAGTVVPPGPDNPLKARWMGFFNGAGIHGTGDRSSIGSEASHGCVRMLEEDVIDLYDRVPSGSTIHVI